MDVRHMLSEVQSDSRSVAPSASTETPIPTPSDWRANQYNSRPTMPVNKGQPKNVRFEYILTETSQHKARLPMRVNIFPHDGTDSIITTVKNFYGLYDGSGVSFEDKDGNTLIARYENFEDQMTVYVRVTEEIGSKAHTPSVTASPRRPRLGAPFDPSSLGGNGISRPSSRSAKKRSTSPSVSGRRSNSVNTVKSRQKKSRAGSVHGDDGDSDSDGGNTSVTSSRRGRGEVLASAEISVENIVEGGRRKRARFDSSELPLFVPSQIPQPYSLSSVSPQRRTGPHPITQVSPFQYARQHNFSYPLLPSPQSHSHADTAPKNAMFSASGTSYGAKPGTMSNRHSVSGPGGILPTPDPTIGSVISDEDVALQLMRLGDASNYSTHGRTSTSTLDDTYSGKVEVSSEGTDDESEGDEDLLNNGFGNSEESGDEYDDHGDGSFKGESDGLHPEDIHRKFKKSGSSKSGKSNKVHRWKVKTGNQPQSPALAPGHQRKGSNPNINFQHFQQPLREDEEDLSSKPRCQRCRKSKKGCDRQRPCGRCKDAGIGADGCVSEDEGNGRKGRYGRHMGVPIKKGEPGDPEMMGLAPIAFAPNNSMAPPPLVGDKSKKRKR